MANGAPDDDTFVKVTNRMIYKEIKAVTDHVTKVNENLIKLNGKVVFNRWAIGIAFLLIVAIFGMIVNIKIA